MRRKWLGAIATIGTMLVIGTLAVAQQEQRGGARSTAPAGAGAHTDAAVRWPVPDQAVDTSHRRPAGSPAAVIFPVPRAIGANIRPGAAPASSLSGAPVTGGGAPNRATLALGGSSGRIGIGIRAKSP
jgi:hypothetical protein